MKDTQKGERLRRPERCAALDGHGKRCRSMAVRVVHYHGDSELYTAFDGDPQWVRVAFCAKHAGKEQS